LPWSAIRAMLSAETGFFLRRVFFIEFSVLPRTQFRASDSAEGSCSFAHRNGIAQGITVIP
jgi:hypothetical protein